MNVHGGEEQKQKVLNRSTQSFCLKNIPTRYCSSCVGARILVGPIINNVISTLIVVVIRTVDVTILFQLSSIILDMCQHVGTCNVVPIDLNHITSHYPT